MPLALLLLLACPVGQMGQTDEDSAHTGTGDDTDTDTGSIEDCARVDADGDGATSCDDCDEDDLDVFPGAAERCNGVDDDCDGLLADGEEDADEDGALDCEACDTAGFFAPTREATDLVQALHDATSGVSCSYATATDWMFLELDNVGGDVRCVYTGRTTTVAGDKPDATDMNTEHTWPQSEGADTEPAKCDLHHLYPSDAEANAVRGNWPFAEVVSSVAWSEGGSLQGKDANGDYVFEPRDDHKGNVARSMLYFAVRYGHSLDAEQVAIFRDWHLADPPDAAELDRTWTIGEEQGHPNPFVVCPDLMGRVDP